MSDPTVGVSDVKAALSEAEQAVKKKFFGPLTREKVEWHPARLLCVRFVYEIRLDSRARHRKSISTKMLWGFTFVPRTPKITNF